MKDLKRICFVVGVACFALVSFGQDDAEILMNLDFEDDTVGKPPDISGAGFSPSPNNATRGIVVIYGWFMDDDALAGASELSNPLIGKNLYVYDQDSRGPVLLQIPFNGGTNRSEVRLSFDFQRAYEAEGREEEFHGIEGIHVILGRVGDRLNNPYYRPFDLAVLNNGTLLLNSRGRYPKRLRYNTRSANRIDILANSHDTNSVRYDLEDLGSGTVKPNSLHLFLNGRYRGKYDFHHTPSSHNAPEVNFNEQDNDLGQIAFFQDTWRQGGIVFDNILLSSFSPTK